MLHQKNYAEDSEELQNQAAHDLLEILLLEDEPPYVWNPGEPESEAYLAELEQAFRLDDWSEPEIMTRSHSFLNQLNQLWTKSKSLAPLKALQAALSSRFATQMPSAWLEAIATQATELVTSNLSLAERLVQCVHQLLPSWGEEDLQVFARPLAYAMRGAEDEAIESTLRMIRPLDWNELSSMEQARLSLAIARYAFNELEAMGG